MITYPLFECYDRLKLMSYTFLEQYWTSQTSALPEPLFPHSCGRMVKCNLRQFDLLTCFSYLVFQQYAVDCAILLPVFTSFHKQFERKIYLSVCLSLSQSVYLSICLSFHLSGYLSFCLYVCLFIYISVCNYPSVCLSVHLVCSLSLVCLFTLCFHKLYIRLFNI